MSKTKFKDNCSRCVKAWNCFSRDDCDFVEMPFDGVFDDAFDDDKERPFENIDIDGRVIDVRENNVLRGSESWSEEDDVENNQYLAYVSSL